MPLNEIVVTLIDDYDENDDDGNGNDDDDDDEDYNDDTDANNSKKLLFNEFRPKRKSNSSQMELQRFLFDDGFIAMESDRSLVMTFCQEGNGQNMSVMLARRNQDDICQRWVIKDNGLETVLTLLRVIVRYNHAIDCCYKIAIF